MSRRSGGPSGASFRAHYSKPRANSTARFRPWEPCRFRIDQDVGPTQYQVASANLLALWSGLAWWNCFSDILIGFVAFGSIVALFVTVTGIVILGFFGNW